MNMHREHSVGVWMERFLYLFAAILVGRAVIHQNISNFDLHRYAHKTWVMPFQARFLMSPVLLWAEKNPLLGRWSLQLKNSTNGPMELMLQIVDALCLIALGWLTPRIRQSFAPRPLFHWLSRWIFLWIIAMTYVVRYEQAIFVPYDMTALLFFNLAIYFSIQENLTLYVITILVAMFNREATVFVLFVWLACNYQRARAKAIAGAVFTACYWVYEQWQVARILGRRESGAGSAWSVNVSMMKPHHWPQILSIGGFLLIPILFYRQRFHDGMLRRVWIGLLPWFAAAAYFGWWNETRVFGEASVMFACTGAILFEILAREKVREALEPSY